MKQDLPPRRRRPVPNEPVRRPQPQPQPQRLRKQPKLRRMNAAAPFPMPELSMPNTATRRKRRNRFHLQLPVSKDGLKQAVISARWISLVVLIITIYAIVVVGLDEQFYLTTLPVSGVSAIPAQEIADASGLGGIHVFAADPKVAAAAIDNIPGIISATVTLHWPNQVTITVVEDSPIAIWEEAGQSYWINADGTLMPARVDLPTLPRIQSQMKNPPLRVQPTPAPEGTVLVEETEAPAVISFIPLDVLDGAILLKQLRPNIDRLFYDPSHGLSFQDSRGWLAYFGTGTDMHQKLVIYETIVADLLARGKTITYISVSNQEKPFYAATGGNEEEGN